VKGDGNPFNIKEVQRYEPYIFFYPYVSTPCILVDVGERAKGGIGSDDVHMSVFDPLRDGKVLDGPADYPLARILLDTDEKGNIYAVGVAGRDQFAEFFQANGSILR